MVNAQDAEQEKQRLKAYFLEHAIQDKLNNILNEMVQLRPSAPYSWLAKRMRSESCGYAAVGSVPVSLGGAAKDVLGGELEKQWHFAMAHQGLGSEATSAAQVPKPGTDVLLTIDPAGDKVLLSIREQK